MTWSYQWTADFTTPVALSGLTVTADTEAIALAATVTPSADTYHYEYLWEAQQDDDPWVEIGRTTDPDLAYYFAPLNREVRVRVSDSNGSQYSDTTEAVATLTFSRWAMSHRQGDGDFVMALRYVQPGVGADLPLDQTVLQPASGQTGDTMFPLVFVGQWQGERLSLQVHLAPTDASMVDVFKAAAKEPQGDIALKAPDGAVYVVQLGSLRVVRQANGHTFVDLTAIRVG